MFEQLDTALTSLLDDARLQSALPELFRADTSFLTPEKGYAPDKDTVNLFLYETKENRELREALPSTSVRQGLGLRRRAALRVDCSYMVTTWSKRKALDKIAAEHLLLGQAFNWLSRFPRVPLELFPTTLRDGQEFEPPTLVAQMDGAKSAGEFWHALGIPPRPYFNLMITLTLNLDQGVDDGIVTTLASRHLPNGAPEVAGEPLLIGGAVRDAQQRPVRDVWVRLEPRGDVAVTDAQGRFIFDRATRGVGYTLRARAPGRPEITRSNLELPSLSGEYDLAFP